MSLKAVLSKNDTNIWEHSVESSSPNELLSNNIMTLQADINEYLTSLINDKEEDGKECLEDLDDSDDEDLVTSARKNKERIGQQCVSNKKLKT